MEMRPSWHHGGCKNGLSACTVCTMVCASWRTGSRILSNVLLRPNMSDFNVFVLLRPILSDLGKSSRVFVEAAVHGAITFSKKGH